MIDRKILSHFQTNDPTIYEAALKITTPLTLRRSSDYFISLCQSILGQQLSTKVGDVLCKRFSNLFTDQKITAKAVVQLTVDELKAIGTSRPKANYILDLANKVAAKEIHLDEIAEMTNEEIVAELTKVKGIGPWTAEMFLMFTLARPDVFSYGDLGLRRGIQKLYNMKTEPTVKQMEKLSKKWQPYRTYAAMILWKSLDQK